MRMWMVNPTWLCRKHLLGEHVETHMFLGTLKRGISVQGYLIKRLFQPLDLYARHEALAVEMLARGFNHASPMDEGEVVDAMGYLTNEQILQTVDLRYNMADLRQRCPDCRETVPGHRTKWSE